MSKLPIKDSWENTLKVIGEELQKGEKNPVDPDPVYNPINLANISGKLISKRTAEGTKSEGNIYFIIPRDDHYKRWGEILVRKKTMLWQDDPQLHPFIDKIVKIKGDIIETKDSITVDCIDIAEI